MDPELDQLLRAAQYSMPRRDKDPLLLDGLNRLTAHHRVTCEPYARILAAAHTGQGSGSDLAQVPYLPVGLFKWLDLKSIAASAVFRVMTSSGTTSHARSRVALDVETARLQTQALSTIMMHYLGNRRRPMVIVDHPGVVKDPAAFSARGAGLLGMMSYGRDHFYALDDSMRLDVTGLRAWLRRHAGEELLVFGFTFMLWQYFVEPLRGDRTDLSRATLVHSGGWKRLQERAVSREVFKEELNRVLGIERVHDFYGMVEQVGSVFMECEAGFFHPPNFADVVVRESRSWAPADQGAEGVIEVLSLLPRSYPGHALLTEDIGAIHGVDDCPCGRMGKRFTVAGRVPKTVIRGCSDSQ